MKFSEQGEISLTVSVVDGEVKIKVKDKDIGIAEQDMPKLFEAFERLDTHLKVKAGGTGLGLYLTKKITEQLLHGRVSVENLLGQGSTFAVKIPLICK